ncbi:hypothetical protein [Archaeoglobus profundus]|uniref:hypothetical protein n=1 Tax=Archaeoglobus profundus TaxID=84156 RepID=UPI000B1CB4E8|nr:hypothetical protein [Archaeoglobus profundus]
MIVFASNLHGNAVALKALLERVERLKENFDIKAVYVLGIFGYRASLRKPRSSERG